MKRKSWTPQLVAAALAFMLSVSAVGNLVTGFKLNIAVMAVLFLWCAIFSGISALLFRFKYGEVVLLGLSLLAAPLFWKEGLLWEQLRSIAYTISHHFHIVYKWPEFGEAAVGDVSLPLMVLGAWAAFSVSWIVCRRRSVMAVIPPVILPLVLCLITTDTVPDTPYLYLVILGMGLLLVTDWTRRRHPGDGIRLTLRLALPLAAALALLFIANPRDSYVNRTSQYQQEVASWFHQLQNHMIADSGGSGVSQKLNLEYVGPKGSDSRPVMAVNAPVDRTIYLRGRDYDIYSGTGWESSRDRSERFISGGSSAGEIRIDTYNVRDVLYVPYYTAQAITLADGALKNDQKLRSYSWDLSLSAYSGENTMDSHYTELPAQTRRWAASLDVMQLAASSSYHETIRLIEEYVRGCAEYDLATPRMDASYDDFARWFLEESDTGYCVHFATTATVLLRAAGIPARYVEGYMVSAAAGEDTIVTGQDAHAWAEYYDNGVWWILEATPADMETEEEPTEPEETEPEPSGPENTPTEEEATPAPETQPLEPGNTPGPSGKKPFKLPDWTGTVFLVFLAAALVPLQSRLRVARKRKQWEQGKPNKKALARWHQTRAAARLLKEEYPEELEALAQKAAFSQHQIRPDELELFADYRETLREVFRSKPGYRRILLRWIFAVDV